jgi:hypothetical protein
MFNQQEVMSETSQNPLCKAPLGPRLRKPKKFCFSECRLDTWVLARAAKLLFQLQPSEWFAILDGVRAKVEDRKAQLNESGSTTPTSLSE